jgi:hypothetical protein
MTPIKSFNLLFIAFTIIYSASAQTTKKSSKPAAPVIKTVAKFKPPVVKTFLGRNEKEATVTVEEANQLVGFPLKITDEKNNVYTISSYQFLYKKKSVIENEQTGRKEIAFTNTAGIFKSTPLPQVWRDNISGALQKGEELYFFDVVVNDKQNRKFFAPDLKIKVK